MEARITIRSRSSLPGWKTSSHRKFSEDDKPMRVFFNKFVLQNHDFGPEFKFIFSSTDVVSNFVRGTRRKKQALVPLRCALLYPNLTNDSWWTILIRLLFLKYKIFTRFLIFEQNQITRDLSPRHKLNKHQLRMNIKISLRRSFASESKITVELKF